MPLELSITPLNLEDRVEFSIVFTELTERQRNDTLKQQFIATVSHELRTPLTSIRGALGLIASGAISNVPGPVAELANIAHKNCERMTLIINDILDLQKIDTGHLDMRIEEVDVAGIVDRAIEANGAYASRYGVTFVRAPIAAELRIAADPDRLMQVLANLLSNAAKFSADSTTATIGASADADCVTISVRDEGIGISDAFKGRMFESFARADNTDTRKVDGTGLGLAISKRLVEAMKGTITFESESGAGATFHIRFPRAADTAAAPSDRPALRYG